MENTLKTNKYLLHASLTILTLVISCLRHASVSETAANMGKAFIAALTTEQAQLVTSLVDTQLSSLLGIVDVRTQISTELRMFMAGQTTEINGILSLMEQYGSLDGFIVSNFATNFVKVAQTLSDEQKAQLLTLRHDTLGDFTPVAAYLYSKPIDFPEVRNTDFLFK